MSRLLASGQVFDTTSSITGKDGGACVLIKEFLNKDVAWLACRHHVYELHLKHVVGAVTGDTTEPGVKLYKKLMDAWNTISIDYDDLVKFDWTESGAWLTNKAKESLEWALYHLDKGTWPRDDCRELLELMVVWLGGDVNSFVFKRPGPVHHARWMAKAIYNIKLYLLMRQFPLAEKDMEEVEIITQFVAIFYAKAWFKAPLPCSAASTDLTFMTEILQWRQLQPTVSFKCMQSCYRHLLYLNPKLVVHSLLDPDTPAAEKELTAKKLFSI